MRVLGIDPGLRVTGYGAIFFSAGGPQLIEAGVIAPPAKEPLEARLGALHAALRAVLAATRPDVMVVEELWSDYKHPATAVLMGHARGVLCLAAHECAIPVRHLGHSLVKRAITGAGSATKERVKRMVAQRLGLGAMSAANDVSDALALALALANIEETETRLARALAAVGD
jgi:crossover junction endodeoxyribonuclease RuvC